MSVIARESCGPEVRQTISNARAQHRGHPGSFQRHRYADLFRESVSNSSPAGMKRRLRLGAYGQCRNVRRRQVCLKRVFRSRRLRAILCAAHPPVPLQSALCRGSKWSSCHVLESFCRGLPVYLPGARRGRARDDPTKWSRPLESGIHTRERFHRRRDVFRRHPIPSEFGSCECATDRDARMLPPACSSY